MDAVDQNLEFCVEFCLWKEVITSFGSKTWPGEDLCLCLRLKSSGAADHRPEETEPETRPELAVRCSAQLIGVDRNTK